MDDNQTDKVYQAMFNTFSQDNPRSFGIYKMLQDIYPALAKKIFENNTVMEKLIMSNYAPLDILAYPVCGSCETLALPDGFGYKHKKKVPVGHCWRCGTRTVDPVLFRDWMIDEIKHKAPEDIRIMADYIVDAVALRLLGKATSDYKKLAYGVSDERRALIVPPGTPQAVNQKRVTMDKIADDAQVEANERLFADLKEKEARMKGTDANVHE